MCIQIICGPAPISSRANLKSMRKSQVAKDWFELRRALHNPTKSYRGRKNWPKSGFYMKFHILIKIDGFKAWDCDFWTARVDAILADVLILKNDAFWAISKESF